MKNIITITGIRPDFVRMSEIFKKLDKNFNHTLIHTGQHFDSNLSDVFFKNLNIRQPDYNFTIGSESADHIEQFANLALAIKKHEDLLRSADLVLFLGDSNSVLASVLIKKMGLRVGHIEAGMRCGDSRMFEEVNRITCDHASDILFCYHENYMGNLVCENIKGRMHVVGNTISEVVKPFIPSEGKRNEVILVDIHRQENLSSPQRLQNIISYAKLCGQICGKPVKFLKFKRTCENILKFNIDMSGIAMIDLMNFTDYIAAAYHSHIVISDSGTAQEELAYLHTPVLVPRDFTERPESVANSCSIMLDANAFSVGELMQKVNLCNNLQFDTKWLEPWWNPERTTSQIIVSFIESFLNGN
jgi:UDP-N-acetylglucosamine 2-epimerase (non-hydrolysing)